MADDAETHAGEPIRRGRQEQWRRWQQRRAATPVAPAMATVQAFPQDHEHRDFAGAIYLQMARDVLNVAELGELAAAEVATWSPKELAAAARRAVTLWRCEQPRAAAAIRIMQRLRLLPSPSSPQVLFQSPPDRGGSDRGSEDRRSGSTGDASGSGRELETRLLADAGGKGRKETFPRSRGIGRAAVQFPAAPPRNVTAAAPVRRRVVTGGAYNYAVVVEKPLRPHQLQLAQLVERLVRAANGRLPEGFGSRELSSFIWSLVALGYWQPPLVPLVSAFADYGAERLRSQPNPIATAMLLQVLAKARAAAASGQDTAAKLLELAPATTVAAAAALPGCLPSCEPRTLAGLLHSCAVLLSPERSVEGVRRLPLGPGAGSTVAAAAAGSGFGSGSGPQVPNGSEFEGHLGGRTTDALAALARSAVKECIRRRFYGFGAVDLLSAAGALAALQQYCYVPPPQLQSGSGNHRLGDDGGGNGGGGGGDGGEYEAAWALLSSAVSSRSPGGPPMAGATPRQRVDLLKAVWSVRISADGQMLDRRVDLGNSPSIPVQENRIHYNSFTLNDQTYHVGDCVYLYPEDEQFPPYIARILAAFVDRNVQSGADPHCIEVKWFERRVNLEPSTKGIEESEREVFELEDTDINPIGCISGKCRIVKAANYEEASGDRGGGEEKWHGARPSAGMVTPPAGSSAAATSNRAPTPSWRTRQRRWLQTTSAPQGYPTGCLGYRLRLLLLLLRGGLGHTGSEGRPGLGGSKRRDNSNRAATAAAAAAAATQPPSSPTAAGEQATKDDRADWREGPMGPKTLCNACGVRYVRSQQKAAGQKRTAGGQKNGQGRPQGYYSCTQDAKNANVSGTWALMAMNISMSGPLQVEFFFSGPPLNANLGASRTDYAGFNLNGVEYKLGDCAYLYPEDDGMPPYVGRILACFHDRSGRAADPHCVEVAWYERRAHLEPDPHGGNWDREVVALEETDTNPIGCISGKAFVFRAGDYEEGSSSADVHVLSVARLRLRSSERTSGLCRRAQRGAVTALAAGSRGPPRSASLGVNVNDSCRFGDLKHLAKTQDPCVRVTGNKGRDVARVEAAKAEVASARAARTAAVVPAAAAGMAPGEEASQRPQRQAALMAASRTAQYARTGFFPLDTIDLQQQQQQHTPDNAAINGQIAMHHQHHQHEADMGDVLTGAFGGVSSAGAAAAGAAAAGPGSPNCSSYDSCGSLQEGVTVEVVVGAADGEAECCGGSVAAVAPAAAAAATAATVPTYPLLTSSSVGAAAGSLMPTPAQLIGGSGIMLGGVEESVMAVAPVMALPLGEGQLQSAVPGALQTASAVAAAVAAAGVLGTASSEFVLECDTTGSGMFFASGLDCQFSGDGVCYPADSHHHHHHHHDDHDQNGVCHHSKTGCVAPAPSGGQCDTAAVYQGTGAVSCVAQVKSVPVSPCVDVDGAGFGCGGFGSVSRMLDGVLASARGYGSQLGCGLVGGLDDEYTPLVEVEVDFGLGPASAMGDGSLFDGFDSGTCGADTVEDDDPQHPQSQPLLAQGPALSASQSQLQLPLPTTLVQQQRQLQQQHEEQGDYGEGNMGVVDLSAVAARVAAFCPDLAPGTDARTLLDSLPLLAQTAFLPHGAGSAAAAALAVGDADAISLVAAAAPTSVTVSAADSAASDEGSCSVGVAVGGAVPGEAVKHLVALGRQAQCAATEAMAADAALQAANQVLEAHQEAARKAGEVAVSKLGLLKDCISTLAGGGEPLVAGEVGGHFIDLHDLGTVGGLGDMAATGCCYSFDAADLLVAVHS
ncbi:hypothetical protein VOLCADRAFT_98336 [Volvox carteri f. nagariensis]|uniref:BAH domain-containing protein n=1 Tax=Volvox carteri f. nagariensis TaxID=3068 RepID=D8UF31_VOLCA|nr:uncharacterized protein VOLCADRAFT_98336 [Volvox carteri f. nagariensis]EFJ41609.1 hypothetical protein VOLCADRAFT_98336 [Volvox carteri f. nagariensis]|eukprot:XP_002957265.1 hypothetical protein VOLCADRAFT_98336 [Volvox carteri f. nagariensis]